MKLIDIDSANHSDKNSVRGEQQDELLRNANNLYHSMRITIDARFQAGKRLESLNTYTFITSIIISLALIFLPLIQFSDIKLHYSNNVLSTLQIFFAVAILVYSVLISTAKYSIRAKEMTVCADLVKDLSRELKDIIALSQRDGENITKNVLNDYNKRYRECLRNSENHSDQDYHFVKNTIKMKDLEKTDINWFRKNIWHRIIRFWLKMTVSMQYIFPSFLTIFVFVVISDVLGYTKIIQPFLLK